MRSAIGRILADARTRCVGARRLADVTAEPPDPGLIASLRGLDRDGRLLFAMRTLRMFGYGFLAVVLVLYLAAAGLDPLAIGIVLTLTLIGDTIISLWLTTNADRFGRRRDAGRRGGADGRRRDRLRADRAGCRC